MEKVVRCRTFHIQQPCLDSQINDVWVLLAGIHATLMSLSDNMEFWSRRLKSQSGPERRPSGDWEKMEDALASLINLLEDAALLVDGTQLERDRAKKIPHAR